MTPEQTAAAEMRERAANKAERLFNATGPDPEDKFARDVGIEIAQAIRALPLPVEPPSPRPDQREAMAMAREALFRCEYDMQVHRIFITSREKAFSAEIYDAAIRGASDALAAVDAALKGEGT